VLYMVILDIQEMDTRSDGLVLISLGKRFCLERGKSCPMQPETCWVLKGKLYGVRGGLNQELPMEGYEGSETLQTYQRGLKSLGSFGEPGMLPRRARDARSPGESQGCSLPRGEPGMLPQELACGCHLPLPKGRLEKPAAS